MIASPAATILLTLFSANPLSAANSFTDINRLKFLALSSLSKPRFTNFANSAILFSNSLISYFISAFSFNNIDISFCLIISLFFFKFNKIVIVEYDVYQIIKSYENKVQIHAPYSLVFSLKILSF